MYHVKWATVVLYKEMTTVNDWEYSWPLNKRDLNWVDPLVLRYFSTKLGWKIQYLRDAKSAYVKGQLCILNMHGFWYIQGRGAQFSIDTRDHCIFLNFLKMELLAFCFILEMSTVSQTMLKGSGNSYFVEYLSTQSSPTLGGRWGGISIL